jgi:hypothetical protein
VELIMIFSDFPLAPRDDDQTAANSTPGPKQTFQPAAMAARLEEANARAYEQYKLRREDKQPSKLPQDAAHQPSEEPQIPVDRFGTTVPSDQPSLFGRRAVRITGLLLVACIGGAAIAWQTYGDAVRGMIVGLQFAPSSLLPPKNSKLPAQPSPPIVQAVAAEAALAQPAPQTQTATNVTPIALPPELVEKLQKMANDIATLGNRIEQIKINQDQMAHDNAKIAEQLKASQEKVDAKASQQNLRPGSAPPPQPISTPTQEQAVILGVLTDNKGPMTPSELASATGRPNRNIRQLLYKMAKSGEIFQYGRGRYDIQPNAGNNDRANNKRPSPALPSPQAAPKLQDQQQFQ